MARPAKPINVIQLIASLEHSGWFLNFTHETIIRDALKAAHPDYLTNRLPNPQEFIKLLKPLAKLDAGTLGSMTCRQFWDYFPEMGYTTVFQMFKYLRSINAAIAYHYGYSVEPIAS